MIWYCCKTNNELCMSRVKRKADPYLCIVALIYHTIRFCLHHKKHMSFHLWFYLNALSHLNPVLFHMYIKSPKILIHFKNHKTDTISPLHPLLLPFQLLIIRKPPLNPWTPWENHSSLYPLNLLPKTMSINNDKSLLISIKNSE